MVVAGRQRVERNHAQKMYIEINATKPHCVPLNNVNIWMESLKNVVFIDYQKIFYL